MSRYKRALVASLCLIVVNVRAQELFVQAEPASNMPTRSTGIRLSNWLMDEVGTDRVNYHFIPEVMWGVDKNLMVHVEGFFSNRTGGFVAEGAGLYVKYRFLSKDAVNRHFRMAAFGRASTNNAPIHQDEIQTNAHNTGYQVGAIATQLLHKVAISVTTYYQRAIGNFGGNDLPAGITGNALNYSLSVGKLMLPRVYTSYKQVNLNLMLEVLGEVLPDRGMQFVDVAPSVQFIFNSQTRLDIGYKHELAGNMVRTAPNGFLVRVEHLLFNSI